MASLNWQANQIKSSQILPSTLLFWLISLKHNDRNRKSADKLIYMFRIIQCNYIRKILNKKEILTQVHFTKAFKINFIINVEKNLPKLKIDSHAIFTHTLYNKLIKVL